MGESHLRRRRHRRESRKLGLRDPDRLVEIRELDIRVRDERAVRYDVRFLMKHQARVRLDPGRAHRLTASPYETPSHHPLARSVIKSILQDVGLSQPLLHTIAREGQGIPFGLADPRMRSHALPALLARINRHADRLLGTGGASDHRGDAGLRTLLHLERDLKGV